LVACEFCYVSFVGFNAVSAMTPLLSVIVAYKSEGLLRRAPVASSG
jgi:hypothetical protein